MCYPAKTGWEDLITKTLLLQVRFYPNPLQPSSSAAPHTMLPTKKIWCPGKNRGKGKQQIQSFEKGPDYKFLFEQTRQNCLVEEGIEKAWLPFKSILYGYIGSVNLMLKTC